MSNNNPSTPNASVMEQRYGRGARRVRDRRLVVWGGALIGALLLVWIGYAVFGGQAAASGEVAVFHPDSAKQATVTVTFKHTDGRRATCAVSALNSVGSAVGTKQFVLEPGQTSLVIRVNTVEPATQAQVDFCR